MGKLKFQENFIADGENILYTVIMQENNMGDRGCIGNEDNNIGGREN